jgi:hypothetical protein
MFSTPAGPPRHKPPLFDGPELHIHPQRSYAIDARERMLVCVFLQRLIVWRARRRQIDELRDALGLLLEVAATAPARPDQRV